MIDAWPLAAPPRKMNDWQYTPTEATEDTQVSTREDADATGGGPLEVAPLAPSLRQESSLEKLRRIASTTLP